MVSNAILLLPFRLDSSWCARRIDRTPAREECDELGACRIDAWL
jgi:hypothetical protein